MNQMLSLRLGPGTSLARILPMTVGGSADGCGPGATAESAAPAAAYDERADPPTQGTGSCADPPTQGTGSCADRPWAALALHEMRQPLTVIGGYARLLQRKATYDAHAVEQILGETQLLGRLVNDMLDVSRLEAGQFVLRPALVDLLPIAEMQVEQAQALTEDHTLRLEAPDRPLLGWWDADRLGQVFANLLANAIKYVPDGGEITVRVEDAGKEARVSVADHGPGIAPAELPTLFSPFERGESAATSAVEGLGLGLYIAQVLVEAHGGHISVESWEGSGSTFTFMLPYRGSDGAAGARSPTREPAGA